MNAPVFFDPLLPGDHQDVEPLPIYGRFAPALPTYVLQALKLMEA